MFDYNWSNFWVVHLHFEKMEPFWFSNSGPVAVNKQISNFVPLRDQGIWFPGSDGTEKLNGWWMNNETVGDFYWQIHFIRSDLSLSLFKSLEFSFFWTTDCTCCREQEESVASFKPKFIAVIFIQTAELLIKIVYRPQSICCLSM
jgi:hypothetical protein